MQRGATEGSEVQRSRTEGSEVQQRAVGRLSTRRHQYRPLVRGILREQDAEFVEEAWLVGVKEVLCYYYLSVAVTEGVTAPALTVFV